MFVTGDSGNGITHGILGGMLLIDLIAGRENPWAKLYDPSRKPLHAFSAVCPHLGCVVRWDGCEKTWDCPCHGSRFDALGRVLNGPAISDLERVEVLES
jgi:Rieske Fe-S protein